MKVLVINAGSSSLKYQLIEMNNENVLAKGLCERIGIDGKLNHKSNTGVKCELEIDFPTHKEAFVELVKLLTTGETKVIDSVSEIAAIGHRVVHGGEKYKSSALINDDVIKAIDEYASLSPLHNPPQAVAIRACREVFGNVPMVAVFDTSFHQTMPKEAYMFGVPYEYYEKYSVRRYGFHGTSHRYVSDRYAELTGKKDAKIITCHLGNGSSIAAIKAGKSMDTTMGLTPLDGFIMGTRCGGIDPSVVTFIAEKENLSLAQVNDLMNKKSGFLGISGISSDCRDLEDATENGNERAKLALDMFAYQIKKVIGAYTAVLGGVDAITFAGGIGENAPLVRENVLSSLEYLGVKLDKARNNTRDEAKITTDDSRVEAWVIPTNEEIVIARDTLELAGLK